MSNPVQERIEREICEHDVVLFMKGTPVFPQCGFSSLVVQVLSRLGVKFKGIDRRSALIWSGSRPIDRRLDPRRARTLARGAALAGLGGRHHQARDGPHPGRDNGQGSGTLSSSLTSSC
jgi:glutaredoxin